MQEVSKINKIYLFLIPIVVILLGFTLIFFLTRLLPGDPILAYLPEGKVDPVMYEQMVHQLGFDQPIFLQFIRYFLDFFVGNLGLSLSINRGQSVWELLYERIPITMIFSIIPIVLGIIAGIVLGVLSVKVRKRFIKLLIQILTVIGVSMPVFFIGMWFQYTLAYQLDLFPSSGDPFLPSCILFFLTLFLTTRQVRSNYLKDPEEKHILSNSLQMMFNLSILVAAIFLLETTFGLNGFFQLTISAITSVDYWTLRASISIIIVFVAIILFLANLFYIIYNNALVKSQSIVFTQYFRRDDQIFEESARYDLNSEQKVKEFAIYRLKSPLTIIGLVIVAFAIVVTIVPQVLTPYSMEEALGIYGDAWSPPSASHPLGQTKFGRDVLALLVYGLSTTVTVGIFSILIGITIGSLFGYLCKVHRVVKELVMVFMVVLVIVPSIILILIFSGIFGNSPIVTLSIIAMYLIPGVTIIISKGDYSFKLTAKKLVAYLPLFMGFNILLFEAIAFLGYGDMMIIQLGNEISEARVHLYDAPWASLWPGLALYILVMGFISLHYGLKEPIPIAGRL